MWGEIHTGWPYPVLVNIKGSGACVALDSLDDRQIHTIHSRHVEPGPRESAGTWKCVIVAHAMVNSRTQ